MNQISGFFGVFWLLLVSNATFAQLNYVDMREDQTTSHEIWADGTAVQSIAVERLVTHVNANPSEPYIDSVGMVIRLSDEETIPFLFLGQEMHQDHPRYGEYIGPIQQFPSVRSCLVETEQDAEKPDLAAFNWKSMENPAQAEVCIYRIATSYGDPQALATWLENQGFQRVTFSKRATTVDGSKINSIQADWPVQEKGALLGLGNPVTKKMIESVSYSLKIIVMYTPVFRVYAVDVGYLTN